MLSIQKLTIFSTVAAWTIIAGVNAPAKEFDIPDGDVAALIQAVTQANGNGEADVIRLAPGGRYVFTQVDNTDGDKGPNALPVIADDHSGIGSDLVLIGGGATFERSGAAEFRFLMIGKDCTAVIHEIIFKNGRCPQGGGAIQARWQNADLTLEGCVFDGNSVSGTGKEDGGGAVMAHESTLHVKGCVFRNNDANVGGALKILLSDLFVKGATFENNHAIHNTNGSGGGIYIDGALGDDGVIRVEDARFISNSAVISGGGFFNFLYNNNYAYIANCYFTGNIVGNPDPGTWASGGGFWTRSGTFSYPPGWTDGDSNDARTELVNCTFYRNKVVNTQGLGGGIATGAMNTIVRNVTLAENEAGWGGGGIHASDAFWMTNTLLSKNRAFNGGNNWNTYHQFSGEAENFDGSGNLRYLTDGGGNLPESIPQGDPLLAIPADNGGPVETMALDPNSPAVNGGATAAAPSRDARHVDRPFGPAPDIGAYEHAPTVTDLNVSATSYLGGDGEDQGNAAAIQSDKTIVLCGKFSALPQTGVSHILLEADAMSQGAVLRLAPDGRSIRSITRLGAVADDLDIDPTDDTIVAAGDFGLVKLTSDGSTILWQKPLLDFSDAGKASAMFGNGRRTAVGADGTVAAQINGWYYVFEKYGNEISRRLIVRDENDKSANPYGVGGYDHRVEDIAIDSDRRLVFAAGWSQRAPNFQSAFLIAFSYVETGDDGLDLKVWKDYNWWGSAAENTGLTADTKGVRVEMGQDGRLYFTGYADGGNNIFTRNPKYLADNAKHPDYISTLINNVQIDRFNNGAGAGSGKFAYFMKADPGTGEIDAGQFQYSSAGVNQARTFIIYAIASDKVGNVLVGGQSADAMPARADLKINRTAIGSRTNNENSVIKVSPTLGNRSLVACWTGLTDPNESRVTALATFDGLWVALGETQGDIVSSAPLDGEKNAGTDAFFSVWGDPEQSFPPGDIDCSGAVDLLDALAILKLLSGRPYENNACDLLNGDLNHNRRLDMGDALGILQNAAQIAETAKP